MFIYIYISSAKLKDKPKQLIHMDQNESLSTLAGTLITWNFHFVMFVIHILNTWIVINIQSGIGEPSSLPRLACWIQFGHNTLRKRMDNYAVNRRNMLNANTPRKQGRTSTLFQNRNLQSRARLDDEGIWLLSYTIQILPLAKQF